MNFKRGRVVSFVEKIYEKDSIAITLIRETNTKNSVVLTKDFVNALQIEFKALAT